MKTVKNKTIRLDGTVRRNTEFDGYILVTPTFRFSSATGRIARFMQRVPNSPGGREIVDLTFPKKGKGKGRR